MVKVFYFKDGDKYIGKWKDINIMVMGYFFKDGRSMKDNGKMIIKWTRYNFQMEINIGQWKMTNNEGTKTYKSGKIEKGIWENGKFMYAQGSQNP